MSDSGSGVAERRTGALTIFQSRVSLSQSPCTIGSPGSPRRVSGWLALPRSPRRGGPPYPPLYNLSSVRSLLYTDAPRITREESPRESEYPGDVSDVLTPLLPRPHHNPPPLPQPPNLDRLPPGRRTLSFRHPRFRNHYWTKPSPSTTPIPLDFFSPPRSLARRNIHPHVRVSRSLAFSLSLSRGPSVSLSRPRHPRLPHSTTPIIHPFACLFLSSLSPALHTPRRLCERGWKGENSRPRMER